MYLNLAGYQRQVWVRSRVTVNIVYRMPYQQSLSGCKLLVVDVLTTEVNDNRLGLVQLNCLPEYLMKERIVHFNLKC